MSKVITSIRIDRVLRDAAQEMGISLSAHVEETLKARIIGNTEKSKLIEEKAYHLKRAEEISHQLKAMEKYESKEERAIATLRNQVNNPKYEEFLEFWAKETALSMEDLDRRVRSEE